MDSDRKALERIELPRARSVADRKPSMPVERTVAQIWEEVLGVTGAGLSDRFFDSGGNSLSAMRLLTRLRNRTGVKLTLEQLFADPTIVGLAALVSVSSAEAPEAVPSRGGPGTYDIAINQHLPLAVERTSVHPEAFNRNDLYDLRGPVDPGVLECSFALLLERHESLRTTFGTRAGRPVQVVHAPGAQALPFAVHDFSPEPPEAVQQFVRRRIRTPFNVAEDSPVRADLLRRTADRYSLLISMHQLVSDGRSAEVLCEDWLAYYDALASRTARPPALALQYKDVAHWRNERMTPERIEQHRAFWSAELDGAPLTVPLPTDYPRPPVAAFAGERLRHDLPRELSDKLVALARAHGVTEFVVARCAVVLLLYAQTGMPDQVVGVYTEGRSVLDLADQIGYHVNAVPLRLRLAPDDDVPQLLVRAQQDQLRAFQHDDYSYEWTMRDLGMQRGPDRPPVFDVVVSVDLNERPAAGVGTAGRHLLELHPRELPRRSKEADLQFHFGRSTDRVAITLTYNAELFSAESARQLAARLDATLDGMANGRQIADIVRQDVTTR